jgi:hypothetical protein
LVRHAPFILPENRNLVPTLFTCVAAHVTFSSFARLKAIELGLVLLLDKHAMGGE